MSKFNFPDGFHEKYLFGAANIGQWKARTVLLNEEGKVAYSDDLSKSWMFASEIPHSGVATYLVVISQEWWEVGFTDGTLWRTRSCGEIWEKVALCLGTEWGYDAVSGLAEYLADHCLDVSKESLVSVLNDKLNQ